MFYSRDEILTNQIFTSISDLIIQVLYEDLNKYIFNKHLTELNAFHCCVPIVRFFLSFKGLDHAIIMNFRTDQLVIKLTEILKEQLTHTQKKRQQGPWISKIGED